MLLDEPANDEERLLYGRLPGHVQVFGLMVNGLRQRACSIPVIDESWGIINPYFNFERIHRIGDQSNRRI